MVPVQILSKKFSGRTFLLSVAGCAALVFLSPVPANAGFGWTPPEEAVAPSVNGDEVPALPEEALNGPLTPEPDSPPAVPLEPVQNVSDLPVPDEAPQLRASDLVAPAPAPAPARVAAPAPAQSDVMPANQPRRVRPSAPPTQAVNPVSRTNNEVVWAERQRPVAQPAPAEPVFATESAPAPAQPLPASLDQSVVQGFGKDLSLAIALRQIAPSSYAYKFAPGVSAGQKVSWDGGKPWPEVLSDMLSANGLQVVIQGNVITVENSNVPASVRASAQTHSSTSAPTYSKSASSLVEEPTALNVDDEPSVSPTARELEAQERGSTNAASAAPMSTSYPDTHDAPVAVVNNDAAKAPVVDIQNRRRWEAQPGSTLRETLEGWAKSAGAEVEWMTPYDYPIKNTFSYQGKFDEAVSSLLASYSREEQRPRGRLYPNLPEGPSVLMIN